VPVLAQEPAQLRDPEPQQHFVREKQQLTPQETLEAQMEAYDAQIWPKVSSWPQAPRKSEEPPRLRPKQSDDDAERGIAWAELHKGIAWDQWHKRVSNAISQRFCTLANTAFPHPDKPIIAVAVYTVTRDGRILNARIIQSDRNPIYNALCLSAITSLNRNLEILQFPQGSVRMTVEQEYTFNLNVPIGDFGSDP